MSSSLIVKKHFLDVKLIQDIFAYVKDSITKENWRTNLSWEEGLVKEGSQVSILSLEKFNDKIKKHFVKFNKKYKKYKINNSLYIWQRGSHITWHNDSNNKFAGTVYLNEYWNKDDGGLFLWEDKMENCTKVEFPEFNKMILNPQKIPHAVSMIPYQAKQLRFTIQFFGN